MTQSGASALQYRQQLRNPTPPPQAESNPAWRQEAAKEDTQLYQSDDFRVWCMKVIPCTKRFVHDWSVCPFAHAGEKAVRRDPRTHEYTGIACPEMKKNGSCLRGDSCPYAHNVFEYWLHPTRYRTQLCNDGPSCKRSICFFAHNLDELRTPAIKPYVSPETLARASLEAIHQNPHPLGQTLANTLRAGSVSSSRQQAPGTASAPAGGGGTEGTARDRGSARAFYPSTQRQGPQGLYPAQQQAALRNGVVQTPWDGGNCSYGGSPAQRPLQQVRTSTDYSHQMPDWGGGYMQAPMSGGMAPGVGWGTVDRGNVGTRANPVAGAANCLVPSLSPTAALSWTPDTFQAVGSMPLPFVSFCWDGGGLWVPSTPKQAHQQQQQVQQAYPVMPPTENSEAQATLLQAVLAGQLPNTNVSGAAEAAALAGRLSGVPNTTTMEQAATLQAAFAGRPSGGGMGEAVEAALAERVSRNSLASLQAALSAGWLPAQDEDEAGEAALAAQLAGSKSSGAVNPPTDTRTPRAGDRPALSSLFSPDGAPATTQSGDGCVDSESPVSSPRILPPGIPASEGASSSRSSGEAVAAPPAEPAKSAQGADALAAPSSMSRDDLAQSLANMKIACTHQKVAASVGTNHEIVISILHQILMDAAAHQAPGRLG